MAAEGSDHFCEKSLKPWLYLLAGITAIFLIWVFVQREELFVFGETEANRPEVARTMVSAGEPVFPGAAVPAAFTPHAGVTQATPHGGVIPPHHTAGGYQVAGLTKATPNGGMQLVANTVVSGFQNALKDAVNDVLPSVCDVHAMWVRRSPAATRPAAGDAQFAPPFDGVIDKFIQNQGYENIGAGVIVDSRGYVLTNHHVVENANNIMVTLPGTPARDYSARIVATDPQKDLAVLQIKANESFLEARLGDSSFVQIGDYVIAIGSPFGMEQTVTSGIVSGLRKSARINGSRYQNLIQTDAPINRGSSGGPLVSLNGEVVGITTAIYAPTGVFNGTGFVVPINDAKDFLARAIGKRFGAVLDQRGKLAAAPDPTLPVPGGPSTVGFGIEAMDLNPVLAKHLGAPVDGGVLVNDVYTNSPAFMAGIQRGDVLVSLGGVALKEIRDIPRITPNFKRGDNVHVVIMRSGRSEELLVRLW
ncbi:MAG: trypsin-like peptidase domain-containing protein [Candidatus Omnitrophica bacterium]|nr:trypsin-like peptidase domain-containing protein [Candidatus Omnitrophota bacterium]